MVADVSNDRSTFILTLKMETIRSSETSVTASGHSVKSHKTWISSNKAVRTSEIAQCWKIVEYHRNESALPAWCAKADVFVTSKNRDSNCIFKSTCLWPLQQTLHAAHWFLSSHVRVKTHFLRFHTIVSIHVTTNKENWLVTDCDWNAGISDSKIWVSTESFCHLHARVFISECEGKGTR